MDCVYLINIKNTDLYKIGRTKNHPEKRLKKLQTGCPLPLVLVDFFNTDISAKVEKYFHRVFSHKKYIEDDFENLFGEWFKLSFQDVRDFKGICRIVESNINLTTISEIKI